MPTSREELKVLRLPNNCLQKNLIKLLQDHFADRGKIGVYDYVPDDAIPPYITLGSIITEDISTKTEDRYRVQQQINIWSEYKGKHEINLIAEKIINLLTSREGHLDLSEEGFFCNWQSIKMYEAYPEENTGYNGVIELEVIILNTKQRPFEYN